VTWDLRCCGDTWYAVEDGSLRGSPNDTLARVTLGSAWSDPLPPVCGATVLHSEHALHFEGTTTHVDSPVTWDSSTVSDVTIEAWFRSTTNAGPFLSFRDGSSVQEYFALYLSDGKVCAVGAKDPTNVTTSCTDEQTYADGAWHHAAVVLGTWPLLFVDGRTRKKPSTLPWPKNPLDVDLGHGPGGSCTTGYPWEDPSCYFAGDLDEVRIWAGLRSERELADYAATRLTSAPHIDDYGPYLLAYYQLEESDDLFAAQDSNADYHLVTAGPEQWQKPASNTAPLYGFPLMPTPWITPGAF
jgi:hypothetical protein